MALHFQQVLSVSPSTVVVTADHFFRGLYWLDGRDHGYLFF